MTSLVEYIVFKKTNLRLAFFLIKQKWSFWLYFLALDIFYKLQKKKKSKSQLFTANFNEKKEREKKKREGHLSISRCFNSRTQ